MTHHPCGFTHGPHPKAMNNAFEPKKDKTEEVAVMLDTRDALDATAEAEKIEWTGYVDSWKPKN
jgi:homogentisate 1,2-dioxygenase